MFIKGTGCVSPQNPFDENNYHDESKTPSEEYLSCFEPNYKDYIDLSFSRRLGRILKLGMTSAIMALKCADVKIPDAIISATGLGCIENTENFLLQVLNDSGQLLSPTPFIHSTHNTLSSLLAVYLKCRGYNITYAHRIFSFEQALADSMMQTAEDSNKNILCGAFDEITPDSSKLKNIFFDKGTRLINNNAVLNGEGASYFVVSGNNRTKSIAEVIATNTFRCQNPPEDIPKAIESFLENQNLISKDINCIMTGMVGNKYYDSEYLSLKDKIFASVPFLYYKHHCGDYLTSSAFAMWCASQILHKQLIPHSLKFEDCEMNEINYILVFENFRKKDNSLILLKRC